MSEEDLPKESRYVSGSKYDDPSWPDLHMQWDHLQGVKNRLILRTLAEEEMNLLFGNELGVWDVRQDMENTILRLGRGNPISAISWGRLGNTWRASGDSLRAIQCFRRALSLEPRLTDTLSNFAVVMHKLGYLEDANALISAALQDSSKPPFDLYIHAEILLELGHTERAIASLKDVQLQEPGFTIVLERLKELGVANDEGEQASSSGISSGFVMKDETIDSLVIGIIVFSAWCIIGAAIYLLAKNKSNLKVKKSPVPKSIARKKNR